METESWYTQTVPSLQRLRVRGHTYWRIVESRRIDGKPRAIPVRHLGTAERILESLQASAPARIRVRSVSDGAMAALEAAAGDLGLVDAVNEHAGLRSGGDGPSLGDWVLGLALRRAYPSTRTGSRSSESSTSSGEVIAGTQIDRSGSPPFWRQVESMRPDALALAEEAILRSLARSFSIGRETLFYDTAPFFAPIRRGSPRLSRLAMGLLVSCEAGVPLLHTLYGWSHPGARAVPGVVKLLRRRLAAVQGTVSITLVGGGRDGLCWNQRRQDESPFHFVTSLAPAAHARLLEEARRNCEWVELSDGGRLPVWRTERVLRGRVRTLVVVMSERHRDRQLRDLAARLERARRRLAALRRESKDLRPGPRTLHILRRRVDEVLEGRDLRRLLRVRIRSTGESRYGLEIREDGEAARRLAEETFGWQILMTDRHAWSSARIVDTFRGLSEAGGALRGLTDPGSLGIPPPDRWTDRTLELLVFCGVLGYALAKVVEMKARRGAGYVGSCSELLERLAAIRRVTFSEVGGRGGRPRTRTLIESPEGVSVQLAAAAGVRL